MSEPLEDEAEVIDGLPVLGDESSPAAPAPAPASSSPLALRVTAPVQSAVAALGGFLAGAVLVGFVRRRPRRRNGQLARRYVRGFGRRELRSSSRKTATELVQVVASRSLLVDVHLLGSSNDKR